MHKYAVNTKSPIRILWLGVMMAVMLVTPCSAQDDGGFFEYYFIPKENGSTDEVPREEYSDFFDSMPSEIRDRLPEEMLDGDIEDITAGAEKVTDFSYIWQSLAKILLGQLSPLLRSTAVIIGILILSSLLRAVAGGFGTAGAHRIYELVVNLGIISAIFQARLVPLSEIESFKRLICGLMNGMTPLLGAVYVSTGNAGTAAVQSGGILALISLCQSLFAYVLLPSVRICLILGIASAMFPDIGIRPVTSTFRGLTMGVITVSVTIFSFVLGLQNSVAQSADSLGIRSIKLVLGSIVPIIGGAVSDSLGAIGGSLGVLKSAGGAVAIVIIVLLLAPTLIGLLLRRFAILLCKSAADMLGCTGEAGLLEDIGSVISMLTAFAFVISMAFVYCLTLFTGSALAVAA